MSASKLHRLWTSRLPKQTFSKPYAFLPELRQIAADAPAALQKLKATQPEDAVFIYFAGHGTVHGQRFYLLPHDLGYAGERNTIDTSGFQMILEHWYLG